MQQICQRPECRDPAAADGRMRVRPRSRDQGLAAVGQLQQQLHDPVPSHPAQHPQRPALQRMTRPRDRHGRGHRRHRAIPVAASPAAPCPAAPATARTTRATASTSRFSVAWRKSTGIPSAILAATSRISTFARRARQHSRLQGPRRRREIDRHQLLAGEHMPRPAQGDVIEVVAPQPPLMPDQQLDSRLQTQQAARPCPQPGGQVLETGSKSGHLPPTWIAIG